MGALYPHDFDDLVFIVHQRHRGDSYMPRHILKPFIQWFISIIIAMVVMFVLRVLMIMRRESKLPKRSRKSFPRPSFVNSMAVFFGMASYGFGKCRAERWFLVSYAMFGLFLRIVYIDSVFLLFTTTSTNSKIVTVEQLSNANISLYGDSTFLTSNQNSSFGMEW